ncbi:phage antirepressor KilAC domain-containing protein [Xylanimonas protaetiae]|uniref:phage antirepressor KilAC domain-containing protein n=1 Tax=Xylanimonas protaetiae TaxID=2509457 RepID=UPI0013EB0A80|nr:phage antirepressor KilAC domain-containing protein [Xylanimonas protaetiae]
MNAAVQQFNFHGAGVRIITDENGDPWFVAADVTPLLGYNHNPSAIRRLDEDEYRQVPFSQVSPNVRQEPGRPPHRPMTVVTEAGLYSLILWSEKPEAVRFKRWVTHEVLPAIRKTGSYAVPQTREQQLAAAMLVAQQVLDEQQALIKVLEPAATAWNVLASTDGDYSLRDAAQILSRDHGIDTGQNRLKRQMQDLGWLDKRGIPYQRHVDLGRLRSRIRYYDNPRSGERTLADPQVRITPKGLEGLRVALATGQGVLALTSSTNAVSR